MLCKFRMQITVELPDDIGRHVDGYTLIHMILDVAIPQLVSDDEGQGIGGKSDSLRLRHFGALLLEGFVRS